MFACTEPGSKPEAEATPNGYGEQKPGGGGSAEPPTKPARPGMPVYSAGADQLLLGVPIREHFLWHLTAHDRFEHVTFHLYVNGFSFWTKYGTEACVTVSPFSLVRNCRFQAGECSKLKSFKVSVLDQDPACYFAVQSRDDREAEEERSELVLGISHAILLVTESVLPRLPFSCDPLPDVHATGRRLMAGYVVYRMSAQTVSVCYCELRAQTNGLASMVLYENEDCAITVKQIVLTEFCVCCDVIGINCSCFVVDSHHFATQTPSERKLWLRALGNVKVKIQNRESDPSEEDMWHFRESIRDQIRHIESTLDPRISSEPLLMLQARSTEGWPTVDERSGEKTAADAAGPEPTVSPCERSELSL